MIIQTKRLLVVLLLLAGCISDTEAERAARDWASWMKYEIVGMQCSPLSTEKQACSLHVREIGTPISLVCRNTGNDNIRCHIDESP